jgi:hypothetical protein
MKGTTEIFLETLLLSAINVFVVYTAAFNYKLSWVGVMSAMVIASLFTALVVHMFMSKSMGAIARGGMSVDDGLATLLVAGGSSIAILVFLTQRFNFPEALGKIGRAHV